MTAFAINPVRKDIFYLMELASQKIVNHKHANNAQTIHPLALLASKDIK